MKQTCCCTSRRFDLNAIENHRGGRYIKCHQGGDTLGVRHVAGTSPPRTVTRLEAVENIPEIGAAAPSRQLTCVTLHQAHGPPHGVIPSPSPPSPWT